MLVKIKKRGLEIRVVELVWNAEAKRPKLPSLLDHRVHEAYSEHELAPLVIWFDFL